MSEYSSGPMLGLLQTGIMRRWWNKLKLIPIGDCRITVYTTFSSQELSLEDIVINWATSGKLIRH